MTSSSSTSDRSAQAGKTTASNTRAPDVNIEELTDRVYRLFLKDIEVQRKRLHGTRR